MVAIEQALSKAIEVGGIVDQPGRSALTSTVALFGNPAFRPCPPGRCLACSTPSRGYMSGVVGGYIRIPRPPTFRDTLRATGMNGQNRDTARLVA